MPIWGPVFSKASAGDQGLIQLRIGNLVHYLESIQVK
jgi:hypothetical protein